MSMNVLFVASEMAPFIKTGGLGDVVGALPKSLVQEGVVVKVIIPLYSAIDYQKYRLYKIMEGNCVEMGNCHEFFCVHQSNYIPNIDVYFVEFNKYFDRNGVYDDRWNHVAFQDNAYRYAFFCRAALQVARDLRFQPDVVHLHDWQTALIPYYIKHEHDPFFARTKTLLTIHNLPYQGRFGADVVPYAKIDWCDFNPNAFEDYGGINFLKGGLRFADKLNTVSPNYAREILTPEFGAGLDWILRERQADLTGILNGIDTQLWNPSKDLIIPEKYSVENVLAGKQKNKEELVRRTGLNSVSQPIFGMVSQTYGALPIARATGGLDDTVNNYNEYYGVGTGFKFRDISSSALYNTIGWANATYYDRPSHIRMMRSLAMKKNYSWSKSSLDYKQLYQKMSGGN